MVPLPTAATMALCDVATFEEGTHKLTVVGRFFRLGFTEFPARSDPLFIVAVLVGGSGEGKVELVLTDLETGNDLVSRSTTVRFKDRFDEVAVRFRMRGSSFRKPGAYQFTLFVDGEWVAQQRLAIELVEEES
jgi:hypothetical protein